jgi:DNA-binding NtrC family response regulator
VNAVTAPTVLVVEDDDSMRLLCRVNLELEGYRVLEAEKVSAAQELIESEPIDLVLLDVHVRGEEGYGLIEVIRGMDSGMRVALMSGTVEVPPERRLLADAVLAKPFKLEELMSTVSRLTEAAQRS